MTKTMLRSRLVLAPALLAVGAWPLAQALAQTGPAITFKLDQTFRATDNYSFAANPPSDTTVYSRTNLSFSSVYGTPAQSLTFSGGVTIDAGYFADSDGTDTNIDSQNLGLSYFRESSSTQLTFDASYRRVQLTQLVQGATFDAADLLIDSGDRINYAIGMGLLTGVGGPFGISLNARASARDFTGTSDPSLYDSDTVSMDAAARFSVTPTADISLLAGYKEYNDEDVTDTEQIDTYAGLGVVYDISPALQFNGDLRQKEVETTETLGGVRSTRKRDGVSSNLGLTLQRPNGTISASYATDVTSTGRRDTVSVGRSLQLPRGALSASLGVTESDTTSSQTVANLTYSYQRPAATFRASVSQSALTDNNDNEALRTRVSVGYNYLINNTSALDASLAVADYNVLTSGGTDTQRADLTLSYRRNLTADWDLTTGYTYSLATKTSASDRESNTIFVGFARSFSF
ncbi:MAG: hypothetical protein CL814_08550 [Confluentimicrobium sp.]|nr:hypothetical protein [Actibacterium sp.]